MLPSNAVEFCLFFKLHTCRIFSFKVTLCLKGKNADNHSDCQNLSQLQYALCYALSQKLQQTESQVESQEWAEVSASRIFYFQKRKN